MAMMIGTLVVKTADAAQTLGHGVTSWWRARHKRRAVAQLTRFSAGQLDDIGLTRAAVDAALENNKPAKALARAFREAQAAKAWERSPVRHDDLPAVAYYHPAKTLYSLWF